MEVHYIAHKISGDVKGNVDKILKIVREINMTEPDIVPFVPYLADVLGGADDSKPEERARGIKNDTHILKSGIVDALQIHGDELSAGVKAEISLCHSLGIQILPMNKKVKAQYEAMYSDILGKR